MADAVTITVRVSDATRPGITSVRTSITGLTRATNDASGSLEGLRAGALSLLPALIPIAAATAPIVAGMGAAALAVGAFGAAVGQQVLDIAEAAEAQGEYDDAVREHGRTSQEAAQSELAYQRVLEDMPPETRRAAAALESLKDQYEGWSDALAADTTPVLIHSMETLAAVMPKLTPTVQAASRELDRFVAVAAGGVDSRGFDGFMNRFDDFAAESLSKARIGLIEFIQTAEAGPVGSNIETFMDYARENSPLVGDTLMGLTEALSNLLVGASETGVSMLGLVNALVDLASAVPPDLIGLFLSLYAALGLVRLGIAGVAAVTTSAFVARFAAFLTAARASGVGAALTGIAAGMTRMQRAAVALGALAVVAVGIGKVAKEARGAPPDVDRLTTSLKNLADTGDFSGELQATFGDVDGLVDKIEELREKTEDANRSALGFRIPVLDDVSDAVEGAVDDMVNGSDSLNALKDDFEALDQSLAGLAAGGHADVAAESFQRIADAALEQGSSMEQLNELFPSYRDAVAAVEAEQTLAARGMGLFGRQALETQEQLEAQRLSTDGLRQSIQALNDVQRAGLGGMIAFEQAIDDAGEAAEENAGRLRMVDGELDLNSQASRDAAQALTDLAGATDEAAATARDNGESWSYVNGIYERGRQQLVANAVQMGLTREEAAALADQILATPDKTAMLRGDLTDLEEKLRTARDELRTVPDSRRAEVRARIGQLEGAVAEARRQLNSVPNRTVTMTIYRRIIDQTAGLAGMFGWAHGGVVGGGPTGSAAAGGPRSRMTLVGEHGPEIVDLPTGSRVRSNPDSRRIAAGMSGGREPVVIELRSSGSEIDDMLLHVLRKAIRVRGGDVQLVLGK